MSTFVEPSFDNLIQQCLECGLVTFYEVSGNEIKLSCITEDFTLTRKKAEILMRGLLLGYEWANTNWPADRAF